MADDMDVETKMRQDRAERTELVGAVAALKEQLQQATAVPLATEGWSAQLVLGQSNVSGVRANATFVNLQANQSASTPRPGWGMLR